MVRRYSTLIRFFCSGYSGPQGPSTVIWSALISKGCLAWGVSTSRPVTSKLVYRPLLAISV